MNRSDILRELLKTILETAPEEKKEEVPDAIIDAHLNAVTDMVKETSEIVMGGPVKVIITLLSKHGEGFHMHNVSNLPPIVEREVVQKRLAMLDEKINAAH